MHICMMPMQQAERGIRCLFPLQEILRQHRGALEAATQALLDKETLFGADLEAFLDEHPAQPPTESEGQVQFCHPAAKGHPWKSSSEH